MAFDAFLKIEGIDGESTDRAHKGEIEISSFSWGVTQTGSASGGGAGAGKATFQDIHFTTAVSKASPNLFLACATGKHLSGALLTCRKAGGKQPVEFLKIRVADILVSSYQDGGTAGQDDTPADQFSLNFSKIEMTYTQPSTGEVTSTSFDLGGGVTGGQ